MGCGTSKRNSEHVTLSVPLRHNDSLSEEFKSERESIEFVEGEDEEA